MRGEGCCFMQAMRAIYNTIRDRLRPRRSRQRTKNYRICRNSAMAKKEKNPRKHLTSGLNSWVFMNNITPANMNTARRKSEKEDGVHEELQERLRSSLQASQERRKPQWVVQRGSKQNSLAVSMEGAQARDLQPGKPQHDETQAQGNHQLGEAISEVIKEAQTGEDFQPAEPASKNISIKQFIAQTANNSLTFSLWECY